MKPVGTRGELAGALRAFRGAFFAVGGFSLAINVLLLVPALYMLQVYDRVLASRNGTTLLMLTLILAGLLLLEAGLELVRSRVMVRASAGLDLQLAARVFDASFARFLHGNRSSPAQALGDLTRVRQFLTGKGLFAFFDVPWTPIFIVVVFLLHPWLGLFALGSALVLFVLAWLNERATAPLLDEATRQSQAAGAFAAANVRNAEVTHALGMLPGLRRRWFERQQASLERQARASDRAGTIGAVTKFCRAGMQSGILAAGALLVIDNQLTAGGMIAASILVGRALAPVDLAISTWRSLVDARGAYARLDALLRAHPAPEPHTALPRPRGAVALEAVVVAAPGASEPILKGVTLDVPAGASVAVIGPSAAGKSTLARALVGVWQPAGGHVRLDGADVSQWPRESLGPCIGYVPQDVELMEGTIAENICRFDEHDSAAVVTAAQNAGVHEMILRLPRGYDTPVGEGGAVLSAGQRQRVALARALYRDPALVVLDEPNANLDEAGDNALLEALRRLRSQKRTVFVVTHRSNVLNEVDSVLALADGRVRAFGPRENVLRTPARAA